MNHDPPFTVVTVSFNRAELLPRVYDCLKQQTCQKFEWLIVDDGSNDATEELVKGWVAQHELPIRHFRQENQGWHVGFNLALSHARGRYITHLDSDDWFPPDALENWLACWESIPLADRSRYFSVCGLCARADGQLIGDRFPSHDMDTDHLELRLRWRVQGDKAVCCQTAIAREFPYPENLGQFVTISLAWNRAALHYRSRCVNMILKYVEYQPDGLSARTIHIRAQSPAAACLFYRELLSCGRQMRWLDRLKARSNLARFSSHLRQYVGKSAKGGQSVPLGLVPRVIGFLAYLRDRRVIRRRSVLEVRVPGQYHSRPLPFPSKRMSRQWAASCRILGWLIRGRHQ